MGKGASQEANLLAGADALSHQWLCRQQGLHSSVCWVAAICSLMWHQFSKREHCSSICFPALPICTCQSDNDSRQVE